jgi:hypothetical protein
MTVVEERRRKRTRVCGVSGRCAALLTAVLVADGLFLSAVPTVEGAPPRRTSTRTTGFRDAAAQSGERVKTAESSAPGAPGAPGDLDARIVFEVPTNLDRRQRELLEEFAKISRESTYPEAQSFANRSRVFYAHRDKLRK